MVPLHATRATLASCLTCGSCRPFVVSITVLGAGVRDEQNCVVHFTGGVMMLFVSSHTRKWSRDPC
jgi:hypothetical protein